MDKSYQVYALQNTAGRFYIGLSEDVGVRMRQHKTTALPNERVRGAVESDLDKQGNVFE